MEITLARQIVAAVATDVGAVLIDGKKCVAAQFMIYTKQWIKSNYEDPIREAEDRLPTNKRTHLRRATINAIPRTPNYNSNRRKESTPATTLQRPAKELLALPQPQTTPVLQQPTSSAKPK